MTKCKSMTNAFDRVVSNPTIPFHPTIPNVGLDFDQSIGISIGDQMVIFIPAVDIFGPCSDLGGLLRSPKVVGAIINCVKEVWIIESEPTLGNAFGLLVHTEKGRCVMSGQGTVSNEERAKDGKRPVAHFLLNTVYDNVTANKRTVSVGGSTSNTGWEVHGSVTWTL